MVYMSADTRESRREQSMSAVRDATDDVCRAAGITPEELCSEARKWPLSESRWSLLLLAKSRAPYVFSTDVCRAFGCNHAVFSCAASNQENKTVRLILQGAANGDEQVLLRRIAKIRKTVASVAAVPEDLLAIVHGDKNNRVYDRDDVADARVALVRVLKEDLDMSTTAASDAAGYRHHSWVITNPKYRTQRVKDIAEKAMVLLAEDSQ